MNYLQRPLLLFQSRLITIFDICGTIQEQNLPCLTRGLKFDLEQLERDQKKLTNDYKNAIDRVNQEVVGEKFE